MDINIWIGFSGVLATIIFGVLSIYLFKSKRYPGELTFISEQTLGLFNSIIKNFPEIKIQYDNKSIDQQIALLKGFIVNSGTIDIKESMVDDKLKLKLPNGFKWLSAKIVDSTSGNKSHISVIENNIVEFNLGLFRKDEFIKFEALVDIPIDDESPKSFADSLSNKLLFEHRIADTNKVINRTYDLAVPKLLRKSAITEYIMLVVLFIGLVYSIRVLKSENELAIFTYSVNSDSTLFEVKAMPHLNDSIELIKINGDSYKTISLSEFNSSVKEISIKEWFSDSQFTEFIGKNMMLIIVFINGIMFIQLLFITLLTPLNDIRKTKKLRRSLNLE